MSQLTSGSYEQHKMCTVGQTVIATLDNGREVSGTVVKNIGATVYVASDSGGMAEFRRITDTPTGEKVILFGIDGKDVTNHEDEHGVNSNGVPITKESSTLSFDHRVVDFESETQEIALGDETSEN